MFTCLKVLQSGTGRIVGVVPELAGSVVCISMHCKDDESRFDELPDRARLEGLLEVAADVMTNTFILRKSLLKLVDNCERVFGPGSAYESKQLECNEKNSQFTTLAHVGSGEEDSMTAVSRKDPCFVEPSLGDLLVVGCCCFPSAGAS